MPAPETEIWLVALEVVAPAITEFLQRPAQTSSLAAFADPDLVNRIAAGDHDELARTAARLLLSRHVGLRRAFSPFARESGGKPYLADAPHFNLTHSGDRTLVAISTSSPVGIDLELIRHVRIADERRARLELIAETLGPGIRVATNSPEARFAQAWVRLEALAKATGEGIGSILTRFGARRGHGPLPAHADTAGFTVHDLDVGQGYAAAIAHGTEISARTVSHFPDTAEALAQVLEASRVTKADGP